MAIAKEQGFELDSKELEEAVTGLVVEEGELSEEDLDNVAGGGKVGVAVAIADNVHPNWKSDVASGATTAGKAVVSGAETAGRAVASGTTAAARTVARTARRIFGGW